MSATSDLIHPILVDLVVRPVLGMLTAYLVPEMLTVRSAEEQY